MPTPAEIKKALRDAGLEIYRTRGDVVFVAERVRENLLMDSGIFVDAQHPTVGFIVRAQRSDFSSAPDEQLFERARRLGDPAAARGYREAGTELREVRDPGDERRTLDTWCEVQFERRVESIDAAVSEVRFALSLEKAASPR
jgi:hypothetical protein